MFRAWGVECRRTSGLGPVLGLLRFKTFSLMKGLSGLMSEWASSWLLSNSGQSPKAITNDTS